MSDDLDSSTPYDWWAFLRGIFSIGIVVTVYVMADKDNDDVISYATKQAVRGTGVFMTSLFIIPDVIREYIVRHYWIPAILVMVTWVLFPELIEDIVFLAQLGWKRYKDLFA